MEQSNSSSVAYDRFYKRIWEALKREGRLYVKTIRDMIDKGDCPVPSGLTVAQALDCIDVADQWYVSKMLDNKRKKQDKLNNK